jgi:transposase
LEHLKQLSAEEKANRKQEAAALKAQGKTNEEIGNHFGVTEGAVRKWFK